jgi:hypothetical protein
MRWWSGLLIGLLGLVMAQPLRAQGTNQAGLVVVHGNGQIVSRCIDFTEPAISGYDLLQRSGLDLNIEVSGMGAVICRIDGEGCTYPQQSCFCGTEGDSYIYWSYWLLANDGWQYANLGASNQMVQPGTVQGWVWGAGSNNSANPPPLVSFGELCVAPTATPTATPSATATPTTTPLPDTPTMLPASPTALPPTATAPPLPTSEPTATPTWTPLPPATSTVIAPWTPTPPPRIVLFAANPFTVTAGGTALLLWQVENANEVWLRSDAGESLIGPVGNLSVQPTQNSVYHLIARNSSGETIATVNLVVSALPTVVVISAAAPPVAPTSQLPTPMPSLTVVAPVAPPLPTAPLPPPPPAGVSQTQTLTSPTSSAATVLATATLTPTMTLVPVRYVVVTLPPPPTTDPAATRLQLLTVVGGVVLALVAPLGLLGLAALIWLVKERP